MTKITAFKPQLSVLGGHHAVLGGDSNSLSEYVVKHDYK